METPTNGNQKNVIQFAKAASGNTTMVTSVRQRNCLVTVF